MYPYIHLFGKDIGVYGLIAVTALIAGGIIINIRAKKRNISNEDAFYMYLFAIIGMLIGAKLLAVIVNLPEMIKHYHDLINHTKAYIYQYIIVGMVFYGGLIGGFVGALVYSRLYRVPFPDYLDILIPAIPLIHGISRIGCFFAGCCYGIECAPPLGIAFKNSIGAPNGVYLLPVQLIESFINILVFIVLSVYTKKNRKVKTAGLYFILYSSARFILEYFRGDEIRGKVWIFTTSQYIALALIVTGSIFIYKSGELSEYLYKITAKDGVTNR